MRKMAGIDAMVQGSRDAMEAKKKEETKAAAKAEESKEKGNRTSMGQEYVVNEETGELELPPAEVVDEDDEVIEGEEIVEGEELKN